MSENPDYVRFFEHVFVPDELFFQTIIMNSALRDTVVNDNLRYVDWTREPAPAVSTRDDLTALLELGQLFARKFDETVDREVLDALDRHLGAAMMTSSGDRPSRCPRRRRAAKAPWVENRASDRFQPIALGSASCGPTASSASRSR